jgi:hypothetical protein
MGKIDELKYYSNEHKIDINIVTETWLSDNIPSDEVVTIQGFILIRKDRKIGLGGGCAIYVLKEFSMRTRNDLSDPSFECQWLSLRPKWLQEQFRGLFFLLLLLKTLYVPQRAFQHTITITICNLK